MTDQTINHAFYRTLGKADPRKPWVSRIVMSHKSGTLPKSVKEGKTGEAVGCMF